jgi:hypothetical protein
MNEIELNCASIIQFIGLICIMAKNMGEKQFTIWGTKKPIIFNGKIGWGSGRPIENVVEQNWQWQLILLPSICTICHQIYMRKKRKGQNGPEEGERTDKKDRRRLAVAAGNGGKCGMEGNRRVRGFGRTKTKGGMPKMEIKRTPANILGGRK